MGVILVNTAEDYPEDKAAGMQTSIVALGLSGGIRAAFCLAFIGGVALFFHLHHAVSSTSGATCQLERFAVAGW